MKTLLGTDIQELKNIKKFSKTSVFFDRTFSGAEMENIDNAEDSLLETSILYCSKEACLKALYGIVEDCSLKEIEILHKKNGRYGVRFNGRLTPLNEKLSIQVSVSGTSSFVMATVLVNKKNKPKQE